MADVADQTIQLAPYAPGVAPSTPPVPKQR